MGRAGPGRVVGRRAGSAPPAVPSRARPVMSTREVPALMRASIRASVRARSASAVIVARRHGPARSTSQPQVLPARGTWPASWPMCRSFVLHPQFTDPSAPTRSAGRLRSDAVDRPSRRPALNRARPGAVLSRSLSIVTPSERPIRTGASSRSDCCRQSACKVVRFTVWPVASTLAAALSSPGRPEDRGETAVRFTSIASTNLVQLRATFRRIRRTGPPPRRSWHPGRSVSTPLAWPAYCRRSAGQPMA